MDGTKLMKLCSSTCLACYILNFVSLRCSANLLAKLAFSELEINLLDHLVKNKSNLSKTKKLSYYLTQLAKLGGYLARTSDPPPGNIVMWRGLSRLTDVQFGFNLAMKIVGN